MKEKHKLALEKAVSWIKQNYNPIGIIASGSIIRGNADANSDLDIYVIHEEDFRQRILKYFCDVPCEFFINNIDHINEYFQSEYLQNRPVTAHILSTGKVLLENDKVLKIIEKAKTYSKKALVLSPQERQLQKFLLTSRLEDASDVLFTDKTNSKYIMDLVIIEAIKFVFIDLKKPLPRIKDRFKVLKREKPDLAGHIMEYYSTSSADNKYKILCEVVKKLVGKKESFEWTSQPEF